MRETVHEGLRGGRGDGGQSGKWGLSYEGLCRQGGKLGQRL